MSKQPKDSDELKHHRELYVSSCAAHGALNMPAGLHYTAGWNDASEMLDAVAKVASDAEKLVISQRNEIVALNEAMSQMATQESVIINDLSAHINTLEKIIEQQAEAIRLKDEALIAVRDDLELRMQLAEDDSLNISNSILDQMCDAIDLQPSPEILQARDERVVEACAKLVNRFIGGDGILNDTWVHEIEDEILSGEWRKYL